MAAKTASELRLEEAYKLFTKAKQQSTKALAKRASEAGKEAKRKTEENDTDRKQKLKLALEESQKKKAEKEKEYKTFQESLKAKNRPRSLSTQTETDQINRAQESSLNQLHSQPQFRRGMLIAGYASDKHNMDMARTSIFRPPDRPIEYYLHTVFVGDLPEHCDQNELYSIFAQFGNIVEYKVIQAKRLSFISYDNMESVDHAIKATAGMMFNGMRLRVNNAKVPPHLRAQEAAYLASLHSRRSGQPDIRSEVEEASGQRPPQGTWVDQDAAETNNSAYQGGAEENERGRSSVSYDDLLP